MEMSDEPTLIQLFLLRDQWLHDRRARERGSIDFQTLSEISSLRSDSLPPRLTRPIQIKWCNA